MSQIESFLSARLFLVPQIVGDRIYFISNLNGRNSLYVMNSGGSVPEPLLPPNIALQNPHLVDGDSFVVFPAIGKILVMLDQDGDENYQPMFIPLDGGYPEPAFSNMFAQCSVLAAGADLDENIIYLISQSRTESLFTSYRANLAAGELTQISQGRYGMIPQGISKQHNHYIFAEQFGIGDIVLYRGAVSGEAQHFYGVKLEDRRPDQQTQISGIREMVFSTDESGIVFSSTLFDDRYSLGLMTFATPGSPRPIEVNGLLHTGEGELEGFEELANGRFLLKYNIDGSSWVYEAELDETNAAMTILHLLVGQDELANGVLESIHYDKDGDRYALSFSTATSPTQIYTIAGEHRDQLIRHTHERILGIPQHLLSTGEDAAFTSFDGLRISARLYLPSDKLDFTPPYPLVYYIHGGPQSQERPDFAWFSMPFIQHLTMNGFAVFVPNVRGSTGYGFSYMNKVVRDWGGQDRLDHVHAMTAVLPQDDRIDTKRAGVVGRSYGGYMTLTLAARHPELWQAAIDMFGPYDLLTFAERVPATWKPFIKMLVGDPETEQDFMKERSPRTYIHQLSCPMLVVQGKNDPRVIEQESRELAEELREMGKEVEYLMFEDEGHDVIKHENRVRVYDTMTEFFKKHLA
ncbi:MAG: S9 family peptidase [Anaerolineales bacterium]|nr:S9 family peptidase [Anaerolineales bacterium]